MFFIPLLHLHLLIYSIYFSIHKYIDLLATLHRPHIDPTSTPQRPYIEPTSTPHRPHIDPTLTPHRPQIDPTLNFFLFLHCFVNSETIYHHRHISIVFLPSRHFYCFPFVRSVKKKDGLLSLTILIDFFQIAVYLTLFVLNGISSLILLLAIISRVFNQLILVKLFVF